MSKILPRFAKVFLFTCVLLSLATISRASHIVGMDLYYTWVSGNTYKITLVAYGDCASATLTTAYAALPTNTPQICILDGNTNYTSINLTNVPDSTREITPVCPADSLNTACHVPTSAIPGIKQFVYTGTITLPYTSAHWRFLFNGDMQSGTYLAGRAAAITNVLSGTTTELIDTLDNLTDHNSSPRLTVVPTPFFSLNASDNYNPGAVDPDGDSLSFSLVPGMGNSSSGTSCTISGWVNYVGTYSATNPLGTLPGSFSFNQQTGQISFIPNILQRSLVVYNVEEYRSGYMIGTSQREMTFLVLADSGAAPSGGLDSASNGVIDDSVHFHICSNNGPFNITIHGHDTDATLHITLSATGLPASASFNVVNNGTNHPVGTFSWTSTGITPGFYTFYLNFEDNHCPLQHTQTLAYTVEILPIPSISYTLISPATCAGNAVVSVVPGGDGSPWTVTTVNGSGVVIDSLPGLMGAFMDTLAPGNDTLIVYSALSTFCNNATPLIIAPATFVTPTAAHVNPSYCGMNDGSITLSGLNPGELDTIKYNFNGVAQTPVVALASASGTATLTDLCAGPYTNVRVVYGVCSSPPVNVTLANPIFDIGYAAIVQNPSECGVSDGIIQIHGLHPGQTDTLRYDLGGVPQTPVVAYVGVDSTITLSGLAAGAYSNFAVNTMGACPNSPAGCVATLATTLTLVAPPITPNFTFQELLGCRQDTVIFTNTSTPATGLYFHWFFDDGTTDTLRNPVHIYYPVGPTIYTVTLLATNTHCTDSVKIPVSFTNVVHAAFATNPTTAVCQGDTIKFINNSTGINDTYAWSFGNGHADTAKTPYQIYANTGSYTVTLIATDYIPCHDTVSQVVQVDSNSAVSIRATDTVFCRGGQSTFTGIYTLIGLTNVIWDFGDGTSLVNANPAVHSFDITGDLTLTLITQYRACPADTVTRSLRIYPYPNIYLGPDSSMCPGGNAISLYDNINGSNPAASWVWSNGATTPGITVTAPGTYSAAVSIDGCASHDTVIVYNDCYVEFPNVFTPNGDGLNDYFFPRQLLTRGLTTFKMDIYNRWGQLIYTTTSTTGEGWDGKFNDAAQPAGVYIYVIDATFKDGQSEHRQGNITLIR